MPEEYVMMVLFICGGAVGFMLTSFILYRVLYSLTTPHYKKPVYETRAKPEERKEKPLRIRRREQRKSKCDERLSKLCEEGESWTEFNAKADGDNVESVIEKQRKTQDDSYEYARKMAESNENT